MRLSIIGSRSFTDYSRLSYEIGELFGRWDDTGTYYVVHEIVSGGAKGADSLGARWAKEHRVKLIEFLPDWEKHGKRAGFIRNEDIIRNSDIVLAFWDGVSKGTQHSLGLAKKMKKSTIIIYV